MKAVLRGISKFLGSYLFWGCLAVAIGIGSLYVNPLVPEPQVGIVKISNEISSSSARDIITMLNYAKDQNSIKAVVLLIDSPGGSAVASEEIYLNVLRLKKEKPVIAVIDTMGASGAYYVAVASDYIFAKPTSMVGSVGVWAQLPEPEPVGEDVIISGPYKATGGSRKSVVSQIEMIKDAFVRAVMNGRIGRLKLTAEEVSKAQVFIGIEAAQNGYVDEIGSTTDALDRAAKEAGLRHYGTVDIQDKLGLYPRLSWLFGKAPVPTTPDKMSPAPDMLPRFYYLYVEPKN